MSRRRIAALIVAFLAIVCALTFVRPHGSPGPAMRDFEAYYCAGSTWDHRRDPYSRDIWTCERAIPGVDASRDELLPFIGPPPFVPFLGALATLPYAAACVLWYTILVLGAAILMLGAMRLSQIRSGAFVWPAAAALGAGFAPLTSDLALGQIALLAAAGAVAAALSRGAAQAAAFFAAAAQPNVGIAAVTLLKDRSARWTCGLAAFGAYVLGAVAAGLAWPVRYLTLLREHASAESGSVIQHSVQAIALCLHASPTAALMLQVAVTVAALFAVALLFRGAADRACVFAAGCALAPFASSFFHEHDFVIALPAIAACLSRRNAGITGVVASLLVAIDWLGLSQRPEAVIQSALLSFAFACALYGAFAVRLRDLTGAAAIAALAFAWAAGLAAHNTTPVWPSTLGAYHASPQATAAHVWSDEQRRSGQMNPPPVTAWLRLLPLLGSALLATQLIRRPQRGA